jgi:hypothetical protein
MSELFKNIVKLPPPHTARSYSELTPVYTADEVAKTVSSFEVELAKANERVKELEDENTNGNAAAELLIWWAQKLSNAPNEDLPEVVRIGYKRIVNLANLIGKEQLRKGKENG